VKNANSGVEALVLGRGNVTEADWEKADTETVADEFLTVCPMLKAACEYLENDDFDALVGLVQDAGDGTLASVVRVFLVRAGVPVYAEAAA
jgi:hypothetical protein